MDEDEDIHTASFHGNIDKIKDLLENFGIDVNELDEDLWAPLHVIPPSPNYY